MDISSLGPERLELLYGAGLVNNAADLYDLHKEQLIGLGNEATLQDKSAEMLIASLEKSKQIPFERVVFALGIRYVGEVGAKKLARYFKNMDALMQASEEELAQVEDIGDITAKAIHEWTSNPEHIQMVARLRAAGLQMSGHWTEGGGVLSGMTVVVSGIFENFSRDEIKADIEKHGGKVSGSISSKTTYLLAGDKMGPEKRKKAEKLGVKIIDETQYLQMVNA